MQERSGDFPAQHREARLSGQSVAGFPQHESRNISVSIRKYDMVPFLRNIYETFVPLYNRKQITHGFHAEVELPMPFDAAKMEMLVGNLLDNSSNRYSRAARR